MLVQFLDIGTLEKEGKMQGFSYNNNAYALQQSTPEVIVALYPLDRVTYGIYGGRDGVTG